MFFFIIAIVNALISFNLKEFLNSYKVPFLMIKTCEYYFENFLLIILTTFCLCFSYTIRLEDLKLSNNQLANYRDLIFPFLTILIIFSIVFFIIFEFILFPLNNSLSKLRFNKRLADSYLERAKDSYKSNDFDKTLLLYKRYQEIDPKNKYIENKIEELRQVKSQKRMQKKLFDSQKPKPEADQMQKEYFRSLDYFNLAKSYFHHEDYVSALYYFQFAEINNKNNPQELKKIREWINKIHMLLQRQSDDLEWDDEIKLLSETDRKVQKLFLTKLSGEKAFKNHDYHTSYFIFKKLSEDNPYLVDIDYYYKESKSNLIKNNILFSEIEDIEDLYGRENIFFFNDPNNLVFIGRIIEKNKFYFFKDIKIFFLFENLHLTKKIYARYGKWVGNNMILRIVSDQDPAKIENVTVQYYGNGIELGSLETPHKHKLNFSTISQMIHFDFSQYTLTSFPLYFLLSLRKEVQGKGFHGQSLDILIIDKMNYFIQFFTLGCLAVILGWKLRSRYIHSPSIISWPILILLPFLFHFIIQIYQFAFHVIFLTLLNLSGSLLSGPFIMLYIIIQSIHLLFVLILVSLQR